MRTADVPAAAAVAAAAFEFDLSDPPRAQSWEERVAYPLTHDPSGAFVAERDGRIVGVAEAIARERLWCLSLLTVEPGCQSSGAGRMLLEHALSYRDGTDAGLIPSSNDPRALRLYASVGFALIPTFQAEGTIDRRALRPNGAIRDGGVLDLEAIAAISREVRGAPHTLELEFELARGARLLRSGDRGFALVRPGNGVWLVAARDDQTASELLWSALAALGDADGPTVRWITAEQQWAIDVLVRAGLRLSAYGALCVQGNPGPLRPFIPSPPFA
jgi:GNAT superfamily N-acetyltransferase